MKKKTNGIIFSIDKWNNILFLPDKNPNDGLEWFLERIERAEKMIMTLIEQLENSKTDSILDLGLSKFEHREKFRTFAKDNAPTRKPNTGLLTKYFSEDYDLENSFVIGDRLTDMELAKNLGSKGIFINESTYRQSIMTCRLQYKER